MLLLFVFTACSTSEPADSNDGFANEASVRIQAPAEGETVGTEVGVRFSASDGVDSVRLLVDGEVATSYLDPSARRADLTLPGGRTTLLLQGYDRSRQLVSEDAVWVRVVAEEESQGWVTLMSPSDGEHVALPTQVVVSHSTGIDTVDLWADGYRLGEFNDDGVMSLDFASSGFPRALEARGYSDGAWIATDTLSFTPESAEIPDLSDFNALALALIETYPQDGTYTYDWPESGSWSGSTRDLWYQGGLVADDGGRSSCYCSGITWELFFRAWQEWDRATGGDGEDLYGMSYAEVMEMRLDWYVRELGGSGPSLALENAGLGEEIESFRDWRGGDFIQIWRRSGSGHTVVFIDWIEDNEGNKLGFEYVSCQGTSDGFGHNDEFFGSASGALNPSQLYSGRAWMPGDWN